MTPASTTVATPPTPFQGSRVVGDPMNDDDGLRSAGRSPKRYALKVRNCSNECPPVDPVRTKKARGAAPAAAATIASSTLPMLEVEVSGSEDAREKASVTIHSTVPRGFAIVDDESGEGKKIIATTDYARGDLLYVASCALLDLSPYEQKYELKIYSEDLENQEAVGRRRLLDARVNTETHSVDDGKNAPVAGDGAGRLRQVYGWDSFMNHSCDANAHFPPLRRTRTESHYRAIAIRDIAAGDEVTCDYALFDYDYNDQEIEICVCGSEKCRGKMFGFHALSLRQKADILHLCDQEVMEKFLASEDIRVFRSTLPDGIGIVTSGNGQEKYLVSTHGFEVGDVIFENRIERLMKNSDLPSECLLDVNGTYHLLSIEEHFIHRTDYVEMIGFDCFMQHSCSPNAHQVYSNGDNYAVYATKTILPGGIITCDYMALNNEAVGLESHVTITFKCTCGEKNCRGILRC